MKQGTEPPIPNDVPQISKGQLEQLRANVLARSKEPLFATGTVTKCQHCQGEMLTTNNLEKVVPTPQGLTIITRLPGAECIQCGTIQYDPAAARLILEHSASEIIADYETKVTRASGKTLGVYLKADLARVLDLHGKEKMAWKVLDRNHALVAIDRGDPRWPDTPKRRRPVKATDA